MRKSRRGGAALRLYEEGGGKIRCTHRNTLGDFPSFYKKKVKNGTVAENTVHCTLIYGYYIVR